MNRVRDHLEKGNAMNIISDLQTRGEVEAVIVEFYWLIDHGRANETADLFAVDAEFSIGGATTKSRDELRKRFQHRADMKERTSRHVLSNLRLSPRDDGRIDAISILTLYRSDTPEKAAKPVLIADAVDLFEKKAGSWKIASRKLVSVFSE